MKKQGKEDYRLGFPGIKENLNEFKEHEFIKAAIFHLCPEHYIKEKESG
jgi:hypothetical protein